MLISINLVRLSSIRLSQPQTHRESPLWCLRPRRVHDSPDMLTSDSMFHLQVSCLTCYSLSSCNLFRDFQPLNIPATHSLESEAPTKWCFQATKINQSNHKSLRFFSHKDLVVTMLASQTDGLLQPSVRQGTKKQSGRTSCLRHNLPLLLVTISGTPCISLYFKNLNYKIVTMKLVWLPPSSWASPGFWSGHEQVIPTLSKNTRAS